MTNEVIHLDVTMLQWLVYTGIPFVVDLISRRFSDGRVKAALVGILALSAAIVQEVIEDGGDFTIVGVISKFVTAIVTALVIHKTVWEPLRLTGDLGVIQKNLPAGIGVLDQNKRARAVRRAA